jgi:hypothetical protein
MRVAFITENLWPLGADNKICAQLTEWVRCGVEVDLFSLTNVAQCPRHGSAWPGICEVLHTGRLQKPAASKRLAEQVTARRPDIVYTRNLQCLPGYLQIAANFPVVVEVNTDILSDLRRYAPRTYWYERLTQNMILPRVAGFVCVTGEIAALPQYARSGKPVAVISNSVSLENVPEVPAPANPQPRLVFIGTPGQAWHGVDKILWLAERFPAWHFDLIGVERDSVATPPANIVLRGVLGAQDYVAIIREADVGIGTLALHRKGMNELCSLKHREYVPYGVPIIMGAYDTDLAGVPGVLQLPNTENNVMTCVGRIEQFVQWCLGRRISRDDVQHMDSRRKEACRLEFLKGVVKQA